MKVIDALKIIDCPFTKDLAPIVQILARNIEAFAKNDSDIGKAKVDPHRVPLREGSVVRVSKLRPVKESGKKKFIEDEVTRLVELGLIEPVRYSEFCAAVTIADKHDGTYRLCIDFRELNKFTVPDHYPLPFTAELLERVGSKKYFCSLDLLCGYWEIPMHPADRNKTTFITHMGTFRFCVMPFGLSGAPATFQRTMDTIFRDRIGKDIFVYLDDIILFGDTLPELYETMDYALGKLKEFGLKCRTKKCQVLQNSIEFLGFKVSEGTLSVGKGKLDKIGKWPPPKTVRDIQSFLGFANFLRTLIPNFAGLAAPLHEATTRKPFVFNDEDIAIFETMKKAVCAVPPLRVPRPDLPFILETDASAFAAGACLKQLGEDGEYVPVTWYSRKFTGCEQRYTTYEREFLAFVLACSRFREYLEGRPFVLRTDNAGVKGLLTKKLGENKRVDRWIMRLQGFKFTIEKISGKTNVTADGLSRAPDEILDPPEDFVFNIEDMYVPHNGDTDLYGVRRQVVANEWLERYGDPFVEARAKIGSLPTGEPCLGTPLHVGVKYCDDMCNMYLYRALGMKRPSLNEFTCDMRRTISVPSLISNVHVPCNVAQCNLVEAAASLPTVEEMVEAQKGDPDLSKVFEILEG
jgi:putative transposase